MARGLDDAYKICRRANIRIDGDTPIFMRLVRAAGGSHPVTCVARALREKDAEPTTVPGFSSYAGLASFRHLHIKENHHGRQEDHAGTDAR